jgi:hypothetical protein
MLNIGSIISTDFIGPKSAGVGAAPLLPLSDDGELFEALAESPDFEQPQITTAAINAATHKIETIGLFFIRLPILYRAEAKRRDRGRSEA